MKLGNTCEPDHFNGGVVNGAYWYEVKGKNFTSQYGAYKLNTHTYNYNQIIKQICSI